MSSSLSFETHRPRLMRLAHRMLGSRHEAEDVLQDAYLRVHEADPASIRTPEAFLVTTVTRLALDRLRRKKTEREAYVGQWLPEPWLAGSQESEAPDAREEKKSALSYAALVLLSQLGPEERAAFLLREVFELEYAQIAEALERTEAATRKLVQRAHEHLTEGRPRNEATLAERRDLLARFQAACDTFDKGALAALLAPNAHYTSDGGGKVFAARDVLVGAERIAHLNVTANKKAGAQVTRRPVTLDGEPGVLVFYDGELAALTMIDVDRGVIQNLYTIFNPEKLSDLRALLAAGAL